MNKDVELGIKLAKVSETYWFEELMLFFKGKSKRGGMYFENLKPLYDEYGYTEVNNILIEIYNEKYPIIISRETKKEEKEEKVEKTNE